jgi:hypothetical protein
LAQEFAATLRQLPDLYALHFREMIVRIAENAAVTELIESVLLSDIHKTLLESVADVAELIAEKRQTVEWFGQLLCKADGECPSAVLIVQHVAEQFPHRGDDLSAYFRFWQSLPARDWDEIQPILPFVTKSISPDPRSQFPALELSQGNTSFDFALQCLSEAKELPCGIKETICSPDFAEFLLNLSLAGNDSTVIKLSKWAGDIFFSALTNPHSKVLRRQTAGIITRIFPPRDLHCLQSLVKFHHKVTCPYGNNAGRYVSYFQVMKKFGPDAAPRTLQPLVALQSELLHADSVFKRDLLELNSLILAYLPIPPEEFSEMFIRFFAHSPRFSPRNLRKSLIVFLPYLKKTASGLTQLFLSNEFYDLVCHAVRSHEGNEFIQFVTDLISRNAKYQDALANALIE